MQRNVGRALQRGHRQIKLHETTSEAVAVTRATTGPDIPIMVDTNCAWLPEAGIDYLQPSAVKNGLTNQREICRRAEESGATCVPHAPYFGPGYLATMGILSLLVMHIVTNVGALRYLFFSGVQRARTWEIVFPLGGIGFALYTLYKNLWPVPAYPFNIFPYVVAAWLAIGLAAAWLAPGLSGRVARGLVDSDNDRAPELAPALGV